MRRKFLVKLKDVHEKSNKTIYRVAKESGVVYNTAKRYVTNWVETDFLSPEVIQLAEYYGVDWRDPAVVEIIEVDEEDTKPVKPIGSEDESEGQLMTPLIAPA